MSVWLAAQVTVDLIPCPARNALSEFHPAVDKRPLDGQHGHVAFALAKEQKQFIGRMIRHGRFNSQSEVVREALRRMEDSESDYLTPPPLTPAQVESIYGRNDEEEVREGRFGRAAFAALKRAARKGARP